MLLSFLDNQPDKQSFKALFTDNKYKKGKLTLPVSRLSLSGTKCYLSML